MVPSWLPHGRAMAVANEHRVHVGAGIASKALIHALGKFKGLGFAEIDQQDFGVMFDRVRRAIILSLYSVIC